MADLTDAQQNALKTMRDQVVALAAQARAVAGQLMELERLFGVSDPDVAQEPETYTQ